MIWRLALGLVVAAAIVVIGLQIRENTGRPEVGPTGPTLILVEPDRTPLPRDSGPENNAPRKKGGGASNRSSPSRSAPVSNRGPLKSPTRTGSTRRSQGRSPARKPPKAHSPPRRPDSPEKPQQPPSTPPQSKPPPVVTVPSVCVNGLVEVGDC